MGHQDHAAGDLVAVFLEDASAEARPERDIGDLGEPDRASPGERHDHVFQVAQRAIGVEALVTRRGRCAQPADTAHHVLGVSLVDDVAARRGVRRRHGLDNIVERYAENPQPVGVGDDLVLDREPADARDVGHSGNRAKLGADVPVLDRAEPAQIEARALDGIPEDLTGRRGVGRQLGVRPARELALNASQPLGHAPASFGEVDLIVEDHADHREADVAR